MSGNRIEVPPELSDLLLEFAIRVLVNKPPDLVEFAARYFTRMLETRREAAAEAVSGTSGSEGQTKADQDQEDDYSGLMGADHRNSSDNNHHPSEDEADDEVEDTFAPDFLYAEHYNPEEDKDEEETTVHPKTDEQRQRLSDAVKKILLFRSLGEAEKSEVLDAMFERKVAEGDLVIKQGDDGDFFYIIEKGTYKFFVTANDGKQTEVGTYSDEGSFGELALLYNQPRSATAVAMTDGSLWAMSRQTFRKIVLKRAYMKRKAYEALLGKVDLLKSLTSYERTNLCDALTSKTYSAGVLIIKEGEAADGMYFIEEGTVRVTKANDGRAEEKELSRITKNGYFGELALITHKPRAANVYAIGEVKVAFLDVGAFERLLGSCMDIMKRNVNDYESQLVKIFGSKANISDLR